MIYVFGLHAGDIEIPKFLFAQGYLLVKGSSTGSASKHILSSNRIGTDITRALTKFASALNSKI